MNAGILVFTVLPVQGVIEYHNDCQQSRQAFVAHVRAFVAICEGQ